MDGKFSNGEPSDSPLAAKSGIYTDANGQRWEIFSDSSDPLSPEWHANLIAEDNVYGSPAGRSAATGFGAEVSESQVTVIDDIDAWVRDWQGTHVAPQQADSAKGGGMFALIVLVLILITEKKR